MCWGGKCQTFGRCSVKGLIARGVESMHGFLHFSVQLSALTCGELWEDLALALEQVGVLTMPHCASKAAPDCLPSHLIHSWNFGVSLGAQA